MTNHRGGQLPVPMDQLITDPVQANSIHLPQAVQRSCPHELTNDLQSLHLLLIDDIQLNRDKNGLRCFMFNMCADNYYQTREYTELLSLALELIAADDQMSLEEAKSMAIGDWMAQSINQYPMLERGLDPQTARDVGVLFNISEQVNQILQPQPPQRFQPSSHNQGHNHGSFNQGNHAPQRNMQQQRTSTRPSMVNQQGVNNNQQRAVSRGTPNTSGMLANNNNNRMMNGGQNTMKPSILGKSEEGTVVDRIEREISHELKRDNMREIGLVNVSSLYPIVHTPTTVCVKVNNEYKLILKEDVMNYENLEVVTSMIKKHRALTKDMSKTVMWSDLSNMNSVDVTEINEELISSTFNIESADIAPVRIENPLLVKNRTQLVTEMTKQLLDRGVSLDSLTERALECNGLIVSQLIVPESDIDFLKELNDLINSPALSMVSLIDIIKDNRETVSIGILSRIHDIILNTINRRIGHGLGSKLLIEEIDDFDDLISIIRNTYSDSVVDRFKLNTLLYIKRELIINSPEEGGPIYNVSESVSCTVMPWLASDMAMFINKDIPSTLLANEIEPVMTDAAVAAFKEILKRNKHLARNYVVTEDDVWFEIARSDVGVDNMVVITDVK
jgi:hypothetical protein